jgi:hypothetical protein
VTADHRYRRSARVLFRSYADEVVVASPGGKSFELLSGPAAAAWNLLSEARSEAEMVRALAHAYRTPEQTVANDIRLLIQDLQGRGLIDSDADE